MARCKIILYALNQCAVEKAGSIGRAADSHQRNVRIVIQRVAKKNIALLLLIIHTSGSLHSLKPSPTTGCRHKGYTEMLCSSPYSIAELTGHNRLIGHVNGIVTGTVIARAITVPVTASHCNFSKPSMIA